MTVSRRRGVFAFAKQEERGTPADAPEFAIPKGPGGIGPVGDRADLPLTTEGAQRWGPYKQRARAEGTVSVLAHPDAAGLLFYQVCGAQAVAGDAPGPFTHTFTIVDSLPFDEPLTVWDMVGGDWWMFTDVFVTRLTGRAASGDNLMLELALVGFQAEPVAAPEYDLIEPEPRFKFTGSEVRLEADDAVPVAVTNADSVEFAIDRAPNLRYGSSLTPQQITPERNADFSVGVTFDEAGNNQGWDYLKAAHLGGVAGDALSQELPAGSWRVEFGKHPDDLAASLVVASNGANWRYAVDRPQSDAGGGTLEFDVAGPVIRPSGGGSEISVVLTNDVAGTY